MTRTRNGSISGTNDYDADVDAPTFARVLREIAQDLHMLYDSVTGENSPGSAPAIQVIDHSGADGGGALLGMTSWQQGIHVRPYISEHDMAVYAPGDTASITLLAKPHWVCDGENLLVVEVDADEGAQDLYAEVYDASGVLIQSSRMSWIANQRENMGTRYGTWGAIFQFTSTGVQTYVVIRRDYDEGHTSDFNVFSWRGYAGRVGGPSSAQLEGAGSNGFPVTAPTSGIAWELLHDEMFTADYALAGHLPNKLNRMINGLWEYVTGAPVLGNLSIQQTYFKEARRNSYANEPLPQMPHFGEGLGAFGWDGGGEAWSLIDSADPPTEGLVSWHAPYPVDVTETTLHRCSVFFDHLEPTALWCRCTVMAVSEMLSSAFKYTPTAWEARVYNTQTGTASGWVAFSQIGSLPFLQANFVVPYYGNAHNPLELRLRRSSGTFTFGELAIVGWDFYFEP